MAVTGQKLEKIYQNSRILNSHIFVPQLTFELVKKLIFWRTMLYFVELGGTEKRTLGGGRTNFKIGYGRRDTEKYVYIDD